MSANYYAIIPACVRYDKRINPNAKLLYGEITALSNVEGYCWSDNSYFAELYSVSQFTISRWISALEKAGYIKTEINKSQGNTRKIFITNSAVNLLTKSARPIDEKRKRVLTKSARPIDEKRKSIYENNTINNTSRKEVDLALKFFEINYPDQFSILMMQYKSQINDFVSFAESFEATFEMEGLPFELNVISGRFKKYAQNWIRNQVKFNNTKAIAANGIVVNEPKVIKGMC